MVVGAEHPAEQTGSSAQGLRVPDGYCCARCAYPSGKSGSLVCPECGTLASETDLRADEHRRAVIDAWRGGDARRASSAWLLVIAAYAIGFGVLTRSAAAGTSAGLVLAVFVAASIGWADFRPWGPPSMRSAYLRAVSERSIWRLHLPWLVLPAFVAVAMFVGLVDLWAGTSSQGGIYAGVVFVGAILWCLGCLLAFACWWSHRLEALGRGGYRRLAAGDGAAFLIGLLVLAVASGLGFVGGVATAASVAELLDLGF